ncbi:MAG: ribbon-helix-helix domain-containing protein [Maricaulaceae bacterium]|jgi:predicted DNA-binding ribbon-helix-helix protein
MVDDDFSDAGRLIKRSLAIAGHKTSLALEREFWTALDREAAHSSKSVARLVADIDAERIRSTPQRSLASAVRVWLLGRARSNGPDLAR